MSTEIRKKTSNKFLDSRMHVLWSLMIGITIILTLLIYSGLVITKHSYKIGDVVEKDIKAQEDFFIEDTEATEASRNKAVNAVLTVYDHDVALGLKLVKQVKESFADFRAIVESDNTRGKRSINISNSLPAERKDKKISSVKHIQQRKKAFEEKIGIAVSIGAYKILEKNRFSSDIANIITETLNKILSNGVVANKDLLLKENDKGIVLRRLTIKTEKVIYDLKSFYSLDQAKTMVRVTGQPFLKDLDYNLLNLTVDLTQRLIQPNITLNRSETEERKKNAAAEIKPVLYKIKKGEMLLREGERVTKIQLLKLKAMQSQIKNEHILKGCIGKATIIFSLLWIIYFVHIKNNATVLRNPNKNLLFITSVLIFFFFLVKISASLSLSIASNTPFSISAASMHYGIPLASSVMIICLFMGLDVAIPFALVISICASMMFENKFEFFIYFLLNSSMAAYWTQNCRERKVFIKAGLKLGLLNIVLSTALHTYMGNFLGFALLWDCAFAFLGGIGSGILTAGIAPLIEITFDYTTDIKLLELANLDQPILRRLMLEAPGTYHHSVIVGTMVEAAATEIGANPLLAKVCGYYHDIGKINKPLYFIENQKQGKNKHGKLAPSMSSLILISHVKEGIEIARKNKLGQAIIDTIQQHHGTSLISFFYEKAKQLKGEDTINIDAFRYPGPKPQTREAGLVMLADVVEAASRALENPTYSRIQGLVQNLINKIFSDGQLDNCELTLKDLHNIARSFNKILNGIYHHRIEYFEDTSSTNGKAKDGSIDRQQTKQIQNPARENTEKSTSHLRRLGLS